MDSLQHKLALKRARHAHGDVLPACYLEKHVLYHPRQFCFQFESEQQVQQLQQEGQGSEKGTQI